MSRRIETKLLDVWGCDRDIAEAAWVSTGTERRSDADVERVISKVLAPQRHGVPFEAAIIRFWVRCPRYIETQLIKHRIASINGASARYRTVTNDVMELPDDVKEMLSDEAKADYERIAEMAKAWYRDNLALVKKTRPDSFKRAKEVLRGLLPQAQMTELHVTMNLRSLANFFRQRTDPSAQLEIQKIANDLLEQVLASRRLNISLMALNRNGWNI